MPKPQLRIEIPIEITNQRGRENLDILEIGIKNGIEAALNIIRYNIEYADYEQTSLLLSGEYKVVIVPDES